MPIPKPSYDNMRYYAIKSPQFLDKPQDPSASIVRSRTCKFATISRYMYLSETVEDSAKVTISMNMKLHVLCQMVSLYFQ